MDKPWDGKERRRDEQDFKMDVMRKLESISYEGKATNERITHLAERIEHANANTKAFKRLIDDDIQDLKAAIQGDEAKGITGLAQKVGTFTRELSGHILQDRWAYGIMITIMLAMLGLMYRGHA